MKLLIFFQLLVSSVYSLNLEIHGPNGEVYFSQEVEASLPKSVGAISVKVFNEYAIPFVGAERGVNELYGFGNELEIISKSEMKAYGWCYSVDGLISEEMADSTFVTNQDSSILWFYAYAHYDKGVWTSQCQRDY